MNIPVSVLIPAKNEEKEILECLLSVAWSDDCVVIDSNSSDRTVELAMHSGARVIQFQYVAGGPKKKNWTLQNVRFKYPWVLILDADERVPLELASEIAAAVSTSSPQVGYYINRRFFFMGSWIKHAGYYPSWNLRLLKIGFGEYEVFHLPETNSGDNEVHEHIVLEGQAGYLRSPMDHFAYRSINQFVEKHNRYSDWESIAGETACRQIGSDNYAISRKLNRKRRLKQLARRLPFPHWARFCYHYFLQLGLLDGRPGYVLCHLISEYEFWIWAKTLEHPGKTSVGPPAKMNRLIDLNERFRIKLGPDQ